jgi:hypothetical protein
MPSIINATTTAGVSVQGDNSGSLQLATNNGTTAVTIDTSQNVGIGTASPSYKLDVQTALTGTAAGDNTALYVGSLASGRDVNIRFGDGTNATTRIGYLSGYQYFYVNGSERMRITLGGDVGIGVSPGLGGRLEVNRNGERCLVLHNTATGSAANAIQDFYRNGTQVGSITTTGTNTTYGTSSDYRLKENIVPMTGALDKVTLLKPCTYTWKADGSAGQGFIAHELQVIVPDAVAGEKDAINEDGSIKPQGIDTSYLVATLTAAIQELKSQLDESNLILTSVKTELDATKAEVAALKGVA